MESLKPAASHLFRAAGISAALLVAMTTVGHAKISPSGETVRRADNVSQAREIISKGDDAYTAGRFSEAVDAYANAYGLIPAAPVTAELRAATADRYAQAAVEHAKFLSRRGNVEEAKAVLDKVLAPEIAPNHEGARIARMQMDDPIRTNPALTPEHVRQVDEVRRTLYIAQGAFDLGKFDEAKQNYEKVLRIDPTNTAARRGMEQVAAAKTEYLRAANDHTRAEMLKEVDAAWETSVPADASVAGAGPAGPADFSHEATLSARLDQIIIPSVDFDGVTIFEAVDFLRAKTSEGKNGAPINFTVSLGASGSPLALELGRQKINLRLKGAPASRVLKYITEATHTSFSVDEFSVNIVPAGFTSAEMITRTFRVPPDFLSAINSGVAAAAPANNDPFSSGSGETKGLLTQRLSAQEALAKQGVTFPEGASAYYNAATNSLRITNTASNLDFVSQVLETLVVKDPVMVAVSVTMIRTEKTNLDELGFDWLVSPFGASAHNVFASGGTTGSGIARTGADMISPVAGTAINGIPANPDAAVQGMLTNGLRSGDSAFLGNSIDSLINNPDRTAQTSAVAPGVMGVTGLFTDGQVQMLMRGLAQKKNVDVMARPAVTTRSGQSSSIQIIKEFIYPTEYEPPELPNSVGNNGNNGGIGGGGGGSFPVTPATPTAFEKKDVGIALEVLPVADSQKRFIDVTLNPVFSDFDGFVNYGSPIQTTSTDALGNPVTQVITQNRILMPVFSVKRTNTQLSVLDGATIAIGGLVQDKTETLEDKVPVLGDIPVVGRLFQSKGRQQTTSALIFLVHVELLDPTGRPYRQR